MESIYDALAYIQAKLKAPKTQFNKFGNYHYRKAEDILEAVKPLLAETKCTLTCSDELVQIGSRYYVKATATLIFVENGESYETVAYAREEEEKKGMDGSQVTGASSSYARKYALNGLLCIDDNADSDTTNVGDAEPQRKPAPKKAAPAKEKKPIPARGSEEWNGWVDAIVRGWTSKTGKTAQQIFAATYAATSDAVMQDAIALLEEDAANKQ